jgi:hypothetical protein
MVVAGVAEPPPFRAVRPHGHAPGRGLALTAVVWPKKQPRRRLGRAVGGNDGLQAASSPGRGSERSAPNGRMSSKSGPPSSWGWTGAGTAPRAAGFALNWLANMLAVRASVAIAPRLARFGCPARSTSTGSPASASSSIVCTRVQFAKAERSAAVKTSRGSVWAASCVQTRLSCSDRTSGGGGIGTTRRTSAGSRRVLRGPVPTRAPPFATVSTSVQPAIICIDLRPPATSVSAPART